MPVWVKKRVLTGYSIDLRKIPYILTGLSWAVAVALVGPVSSQNTVVPASVSMDRAKTALAPKSFPIPGQAVPVPSEYAVSPERMQAVYDEVRTPYKYGLVLAPGTNQEKIDCPTVFREGKRWYMSYLVYNGKEGKEGRGYETWLAVSDDLLQWKTLGRILSFAEDGWDKNQRGGYISLIDTKWGGSYRARSFAGKHWMTYIGGDQTGYESGTLQIGLASTDKKISEAHAWKTRPNPVLSPNDPDKDWWESLTQYKSSVLWDKNKLLGKPFVLFYNAGGVNPTTQVKGERIGIALSEDMEHWKRFKGNPVLNHEGGITGDAQIQQMGDLYVMFYFSAFRPGNQNNAFNNFACSYDLVHWTDWTGEPLIVSSKPWDNQFAHKSCVVKYNGVVYHFYCAVNKDNQRGIAVATSKDLGNSLLRFPKPEKTSFRKQLDLTGAWESCLTESNQIGPNQSGPNKSDPNLSGPGVSPMTGGRPSSSAAWQKVQVPHNWDQYYGLRRLKHGNLHGTAWYRKTFTAPSGAIGQRYFLYFEGVGSYATVWLNGDSIGVHAGGRTTFTLDVTDALTPGVPNDLLVKAEHPAFITDLPWVCGGCSNESGFSEGSQPLGIFRPVTLVVTDEVRIQPFGVHLWNEPGSIREDGARLQVTTTLKNYGKQMRSVEVVSKLVGDFDVQVARVRRTVVLKPGEEQLIPAVCLLEKTPKKWSPEAPFLYTMVTLIKENGKVIDEERTPYGFRVISWPQTRNDGDRRFMINGKPVLLNGIGEYEHLNGLSHAFSEEQIRARMSQIRAAGFNAFREAHQPHNLLYQRLCDESGLLMWTQFSAHVWYDTPIFRENFKTLLQEWVLEHRNSPSVILWGLQNESYLPEAFAKECCDLIRELDPTASGERLITTCNGGEGTDWNVVQNWSGTYAGDPEKYGEELKQQLLNGEYGAWRSIGLHTEGGFVLDGVRSEDRMCQLLEQKIGLAEANRDSLCGQFLWVFGSHENPGRTQNEEGVRDIDRLGPFNYKGLFTSWGEPVDAYYLYRANYSEEPMVYLVSHTGPDRWKGPGLKDSLVVYSNCDSVELFNDWNRVSLGMRRQPGKGKHFQWDDTEIRYNLLLAVGYKDGMPTVRDYIVLNNLPEAPNFHALYTETLRREQVSLKPVSLKAQKGYRYLYRVNCGGPDYIDSHKQTWMADRSLQEVRTTKTASTGKSGQTSAEAWGSTSWSSSFTGMHPYYGSQRYTNDPIAGTTDWTLFQTFRYGTTSLNWSFPVQPGEYLVECYFTEPWYGAGGNMNCEGWRIFDLQVNDQVVLRNFDIWKEAGHDGALKKTFTVKVSGNKLEVRFPKVLAGQAIISAIAIAGKDPSAKPASPGTMIDPGFKSAMPEPEPEVRPDIRLEAEKSMHTGILNDTAEFDNQVGLSVEKAGPVSVEWLINPGLAGTYNLRFRYRNTSGKPLPIGIQLISTDGRVVRDDTITFPPVVEKWRTLSTTTGIPINAGQYRVRIHAGQAIGLWLDALIFQ
jgi:beta-galactosidase